MSYIIGVLGSGPIKPIKTYKHMRIEIYPYIATLLKLTLPIKLPGNPCFPSGDLPGCSVLACSKTRKKQHVLAKNRTAIN